MWPLSLRAEQVGPIIRVWQSVLAVASLRDALVPPGPQVSDGAEYDFIVVGGGTAGAVVANRLAEAAHRVLLVEAGGLPPLASQTPGLFAVLPGSECDWKYEADTGPNAGLAQTQPGKLKLVRGKMLGGCSSNNYMHHVLGHPTDYDQWAALTSDQGWSYRNIAQFIKKIEAVSDEDILKSKYGYLRGRNGNINITRQVHRKQTLKYFKALFETGFNISHDYNTFPNTFSDGQFTIGDGRRSSTHRAYLQPENRRSNLTVLTNTEVTKVLFEGNQAVAIQAVTKEGKTITVNAKTEIVLSAGAINSPLILMRSGIGPREHLQDFNIDVLADLPVGDNMQDHILLPVLLTGGDSIQPDPTTLQEFPLPLILGFASLNKTSSQPDYQVLAYPAARGSKYPLLICNGYGVRNDICNRYDDAASRRQTLLVNIVLLHPESRGRVRLNSTDPKKPPSIYLGYYDQKEDLERHVTYLEDFLRVLNTTYFKSVQSKVVDVKLQECADEEFGSRGYWLCYARCMSATVYHPAGTTGLGPVLDARLRVRRVRRLRVADAGAIPVLPSGNINAPVAILAEYAAQLIKEDHGIHF